MLCTEILETSTAKTQSTSHKLTLLWPPLMLKICSLWFPYILMINFILLLHGRASDIPLPACLRGSSTPQLWLIMLWQKNLNRFPWKGGGVKLYQYTDDILIGGDQLTPVKIMHDKILKQLEELGLMIPPDKILYLAAEIKFLGTCWKGGMACTPQDTLPALDQLKMPENKKNYSMLLDF